MIFKLKKIIRYVILVVFVFVLIVSQLVFLYPRSLLDPFNTSQYLQSSSVVVFQRSDNGIPFDYTFKKHSANIQVEFIIHDELGGCTELRTLLRIDKDGKMTSYSQRQITYNTNQSITYTLECTDTQVQLKSSHTDTIKYAVKATFTYGV